ncbi:MAG: DUF309 domain-containing protein [Acidobacteriia bacterium]|nr:DUF309 domain-containing protein [Terriglobia bacterium]
MDVAGFRRGVELFNRAEFFDAHEVLEDVWHAAPAAERKFLQGLVQIAVALHHHSRGNLVGARSLLKRAAKNLAGYPETFAGIELAELLASLADWERALAGGEPAPPLPKFVVGG